ncbi:hypothetical protein [Actinoplanes sp. NPDC049265]|uniref:hypothetical protein n=1 Tax=Actinoplanes sp. NPDC049265 TaxID=3363902 RepID=UPI003710992C
MSEQAVAPERIWSGIDITKALGGALAAVCAAVLGSFLGVAGTLIGAALASIVGTIGTEIYTRSLRRGAEKLQTLAPAFVTAPAAVGTPEVAAATDDDKPSETVPEEERGHTIRWKRVALIAAGVFVLTMGALTAVELIAGKSVASMVGHGSSGSTTFSSVTTDGGHDQQQRNIPVEQPSTNPATRSTGTPADQSSAPAGTPTTAPTDAPPTGGTTTGPAEAPATDAPTQGSTPDSGTGEGDGTGEGGGQQEQQQAPPGDSGNE